MSEKKKIVITLPGDLWTGTENYARELGYEVYRSPIKGKTAEDVVNAIEGADAVFAGVMDHYNADVINKMVSPSIIARFGVGYDNVDVSAATAKGVAVTVTPGANSIAVAECAVSLMLDVTRKISFYDRQMHNGSNGGPGLPITGSVYGATVGLLGFGNVGKKIAKLLKGFDCKILVYDPNLPQEVFDENGVIKASIEEIQRNSDIISLHLPLMPETNGMIDMDFFKKMKKTAILINDARGPIVKEADLIEALKTGVIAGAGLDAFAIEPLPEDSELRKLENVVLTPHLAAMTFQAFNAMGKAAIDNIHQYFTGLKPQGIVNPECCNK